MKLLTTILLSTIQMIAFAQFKAGTFGIGPSIDINYHKNGSEYNNYITLGINGSVFLSSKSAIGIGIGKSSSDNNYSIFNSESNNYYINYQFYSSTKHLFGFLSQTNLNFTNNQDYNYSGNSVQLLNHIGIYTRPYKGLVFKIKYPLVEYSSWVNKYKNSDYEYKSNTFSVNLNPFVNISSFQLDFVYYFNLRKDEK